MTAPIGDRSVLDGGVPIDARKSRLLERASALAEPPAGDEAPAAERRRMAVSGSLVALGFIAIILGYLGAARSIVVAEQVPFLISGGLFGLALVVAGGFGYFSHWVSATGRQADAAHQRTEERHRELVEAIEAASRREHAEEVVRGSTARNGRERPIRGATRSQGR